MANYLFCYGTLKKGKPNNSLLTECEFIGIGKAYGYVLINVGAIPGMVPGKVSEENHGDDAIGEVYAVPDEKLAPILHRLDRVENNGEMYIRVVATVDMLSYKGYSAARRRTLDCITYLYMPHINSDALVSGGVWGRLPCQAEHSSDG